MYFLIGGLLREIGLDLSNMHRFPDKSSRSQFILDSSEIKHYALLKAKCAMKLDDSALPRQSNEI